MNIINQKVLDPKSIRTGLITLGAAFALAFIFGWLLGAASSKPLSEHELQTIEKFNQAYQCKQQGESK